MKLGPINAGFILIAIGVIAGIYLLHLHRQATGGRVFTGPQLTVIPGGVDTGALDNIEATLVNASAQMAANQATTAGG